MAAKTISIDFDGYWTDDIKDLVPSNSGIYCVYTCIEKENGKLSIKHLIYIGESGNVKDRLANHEHYEDWKTYIEKEQVLCYSVGLVSSVDRERCEAAMIFKHNPPVNEQSTSGFDFDDTTIELSGKIRFLTEKFTVQRS